MIAAGISYVLIAIAVIAHQDSIYLEDIEAEGVIRFDHDGRICANDRSPADDYFCTDALCTHEEVHLADGLMIEHSIESPKHASLFDDRIGDVATPPACEDRNTHAINVENGNVMVERAMKERHCLEKQRRDGAKTP